MRHLEQATFLTVDDFISELNKHRRANKNQWISAAAQVGSKQVRIKSFSTSVPILEVGGFRCPAAYDMSVKDWQSHIKNWIEE